MNERTHRLDGNLRHQCVEESRQALRQAEQSTHAAARAMRGAGYIDLAEALEGASARVAEGLQGVERASASTPFQMP